MKIFAFFVILSVVIMSVFGSTVFTKDYSDPQHPGKCVFNEKVFEPGRHELNERSGVSFTCESNGMGTYISGYPINSNRPYQRTRPA